METMNQHCQRGGENTAFDIKITDCACWECGDMSEVELHGHTMCPECVFTLLGDPAYTLIEKCAPDAIVDDLEVNVSNDGFDDLLGLDASFTVNGLEFKVFLPLNELEKENDK